MGIIFVFSAVAVFGVTIVVGLVAFGLFLYGRGRGRGSWLIYLGIAFVVTLALGGLGALSFFLIPEGSGAPTAEQMETILVGVSCIAAAPGLGLTAGLLSLIKKRAPENPPQ